MNFKMEAPLLSAAAASLLLITDFFSFESCSNRKTTSVSEPFGRFILALVLSENCRDSLVPELVSTSKLSEDWKSQMKERASWFLSELYKGSAFSPQRSKRELLKRFFFFQHVTRAFIGLHLCSADPECITSSWCRESFYFLMVSNPHVGKVGCRG